MAFHLHRLKLVGRPIRGAGYHKTDAADLAAARRPLSGDDVAQIAHAVAVPRTEIERQLTSAEHREWAFYRAAASNPADVWSAARTAWIQFGLADKEAAAVMGYNPKTLSRALLRSHTLSFHRAHALTTALKIPGGPEALLPLPKRDDPHQSR